MHVAAPLLADEVALYQSAAITEVFDWLSLGDETYLHIGNPSEDELAITDVGIPVASLANQNVLLFWL